MIGCDSCDGWFHSWCLGVDEAELKDKLGKWVCPWCIAKRKTPAHKIILQVIYMSTRSY